MTPIYRMIHVQNLPKILEWGGDLSPNQCRAKGEEKRTIHHGHIMDRRAQTSVDVGPGGTLADYVASYFCSKSPMLYAIRQGQVQGYQGQRELIFLSSSAEKIAKDALGYVFTNGHAVIAYVQFFDDPSKLGQVSWEVMRSKYWNHHVDGRFKRQAEFLIRDFYPISSIEKIGVFDEAMKSSVEKTLNSYQTTLDVAVERGWYF